MNAHQDDTVKSREISFCELHPDPTQAETAAFVLQEMPGILVAEHTSPTLLRIQYNVFEITLKQIEELLVETGFHLAGNLVHRIKRALHYYAEDTQRANCAHCIDTATTRKIFIERYSRLNHGCQDTTPEIWRHYR